MPFFFGKTVEENFEFANNEFDYNKEPTLGEGFNQSNLYHLCMYLSKAQVCPVYGFVIVYCDSGWATLLSDNAWTSRNLGCFYKAVNKRNIAGVFSRPDWFDMLFVIRDTHRLDGNYIE